MIALDQAIDRLLAQAPAPPPAETVATLDALGRVLAQPVISTVAVPPLDNSAMDGYAVRSADVTSCPVELAVSQRIQAGQTPRPLEPRTAARIFTGAPVPPGCDAVVPQEETRTQGDRVVVLEAPSPGQWIRRAGLDIAAGAQVLGAGARLRAPQLGVAASVGLAHLPVYGRLRVALLFTGDELVMPGEPLAPGRIYNSNRFLLGAMVRALGCDVVDLGIVPDQPEATRRALVTAAQQSGLVISSGGVSVGEADHVRSAVQAEGAIDLWRISIKPGRPMAFGHVRGVPFLGLPGNPVSSFVTFAMLARPFVLRMQGVAEPLPRAIPMRADFEMQHPADRREFLRVRVSGQGLLQAFPVQDSSALTSVAWGDGLADVEEGRRVERGAEVPYLPFSELFG